MLQNNDFFLTVRSLVIQNYGSGSRRPVKYGLGTLVLIVDIFNVVSPEAVQKVFSEKLFTLQTKTSQ
jgi:hypothetical protein